MQCPNCNIELRMADRQGIEIDYCPQCRGVWLDRGELDKIIERTQSVAAPTQTQGYTPEVPRSAAYRQESPTESGRSYRESDDDYYGREEYRDRDHDYKRHKRKSILSEIFDFD
ncbi:MAG TPA: zf-TFIIB domain-containing protein [Chloroflexia bacterium]|nr:zf-TFIIB domain-containing protein [Chloroflexia bacterium]